MDSKTTAITPDFDATPGRKALLAAVRELGKVRGWVRKHVECEELTLTDNERDLLATIRLVYPIFEMMQPVTVYGASSADVENIIGDAMEKALATANELLPIENDLLGVTLEHARSLVFVIQRERS